jgi:hypothetical protein
LHTCRWECIHHAPFEAGTLGYFGLDLDLKGTLAPINARPKSKKKKKKKAAEGEEDQKD